MTSQQRTIQLRKGSASLTDIENLIGQVWNPATRLHAEEAWRCYNAGAIRASIAATWTAITADVIAKIGHLADASDGDAKAVSDAVERAQAQGLSSDGVRAMQNIEAALLDDALKVELIDVIDKRALERIREDRNLCVHPSLRPFNETYLPPPEVARAHLSVALDVLLVQRPTQGRKIIESYIDFTCSPAFVPSAAHIQTAYLDRVRSVTRRNLVAVAAKHALLEIDPDGRMDAMNYADRSASVLKAFALRERGLVRDAIGLLRDRFRHADPETQRRALGRLGDQDFFWDMADSPLVEQFNNLVSQRITTPSFDPLDSRTAAAVSLVAIESVRERLPALEQQFNRLSPQQRVSVIEARPTPYFVQAVIELLRQAYSYRFGELVGQLLVAHAAFLTIDDLGAALAAWAGNDQCWRASSMPETAVNLFAATGQLGHARAAAFMTFLESVRQQTDPEDDYYTYPGLEEALGQTNQSA